MKAKKNTFLNDAIALLHLYYKHKLKLGKYNSKVQQTDSVRKNTNKLSIINCIGLELFDPTLRAGN